MSNTKQSFLSLIAHGDKVTIVDRFGKQKTGRAVMRGPHGWVLNMGGPHGTPAVASDDNITNVKKGGRPRRAGGLRTLGASSLVHSGLAKNAQAKIAKSLDKAAEALKDGRCTTAYMSLADAFEQSGVLKAEGVHSKKTTWHPQGHFAEVSGKFSDICVRYRPEGLEGTGARKTRKRRR